MKLKFLFLIALSFILYGSLQAQNKNSKKITVSGIVTDKNRNPVAGAMIFVDKKNTNKVTDSKGFYKVKVRPTAEKIIVFTLNSGVGEALVVEESVINITLNGAASFPGNARDKTAAEESVNVGYGSVNKKNLTTNVSKLDARSERYASYSNIYELLKGSIPGVQVVGKSITIQGTSSINLSNEPLFVVDGIIVSSIDEINPSQVKSIQVLKGASASIYGSRGANGVILIDLIGSSKEK
jgi:TonB-dependent SusC/RagA subfamily outer membrane receptor